MDGNKKNMMKRQVKDILSQNNKQVKDILSQNNKVIFSVLCKLVIT